MSLERKPKSDAIPATRLGPRPPTCDREDCPIRESIDRIEAKLDQLNEDITGTADKPGLAERIRHMETTQKFFLWGAAIVAGTVLTILATRLMGGG